MLKLPMEVWVCRYTDKTDSLDELEIQRGAYCWHYAEGKCDNDDKPCDARKATIKWDDEAQETQE